ncbi:hypothetical protein K0C01_05030 [Salinarchaeum sp. IM2453]|uniref:hypothetical protein n=1 Tax=Salinarchaeum sp. IM2453 TaxID=2862870 RepID=UPI001C82DA45|nr:hypothetical protein [Salinarchaeum sp. IM2453]QZA89501.1 hypothetical protein K0C01_05030 [Salinarchaeum sp. IM2453]
MIDAGKWEEYHPGIVLIWFLVAIGAVNTGMFAVFDLNIWTAWLGLSAQWYTVIGGVIGLLGVIDILETFGITDYTTIIDQ